MSVQKRRRQAINRRQWVADLRVKWDLIRDLTDLRAEALAKLEAGKR